MSLSLYSSISNLVTLSLSLLNCKTLIGCRIFTLSLFFFFLFFFFLRTNLYSLTLFCFLPVFWLYLGFILSIADLLLVSDSVCVGVGVGVGVGEILIIF